MLCAPSAVLDPRILVESTEPVTLDNIILYDEAVSGDCMVEVPAVSSARVKRRQKLVWMVCMKPWRGLSGGSVRYIDFIFFHSRSHLPTAFADELHCPL